MDWTDCIRRTRIVFDPTPTRLSESVATYQIRLGPGEAANFRWAIVCEVGADSHGEVKPYYEKVVQEAASALEATHAQEPQIFAVKRTVQRLAESVDCRSPYDANRNIVWAVSLRWRSLVQHGIRTRRNHYGAPVPVV